MDPAEDTNLRNAPESALPAVDAPRGDRLRGRRLAKTALVVVGLAVLASIAYGLLAGPEEETDIPAIPTVTVKKGPLTITVTQRGSVWAMNPLEINNEVEGSTNILELVDEGTVVTQQDVENELVLIRLDVTSLEEREADRKINCYRAEANSEQAKADYDIQEKQNESNVALAGLNLKFAGMELKRYLGKELAAHLLTGAVDPATLADDPRLGGMAQQELRRRESNVLLASGELVNQAEKLLYTEQLATKGYVGGNELESDRLQKQRLEVEEKSAKEELRLFKLYTLPKEAEQRQSDCIERERDLVRVVARANSRIAQAEWNLESKERSLTLEQERLQKVQDMIQKCVILAPRPGLVIYGSSGSEMYGRSSRIEEGASIRENVTMLRMPEATDLAVRMNIPEINIDKIKVGQPALITMEAAPNKPVLGKVARISPMANPAHAWLDPDAKVYETHVTFEEVLENFIPGMSATAEIVVARLRDAIYVPAQAVCSHKGISFCWVKGVEEPRLLRTGLFSDKYIEIKDGLREGEEVYLASPRELDAELLAQLEEARGAMLPVHESPQAEETEAAQPPHPGAEGPSDRTGDDRASRRQMFQELEGLSGEERAKKLQEILEKLPPEQRRQMEERGRQRESMSPEERGRMRGQGPGGGRGPRGR